MRSKDWRLSLNLALILVPAVFVVWGNAEAQGSRESSVPRRAAVAATGPGKHAADVRWTPVLPPVAEGVTDLSFGKLLVVPIGPAGLELSADAKKAMGRPIRMVGHMVRQMQPIPWTFLLSPVPQSLHEREYFLCESLPASAVRVHMPKGPQPIVPYRSGLVAVTGMLTTEGPEESDGRSSPARLVVRPGDTHAMVFVTAYSPSERAALPAATAPSDAPSSARNQRNLQTDTHSK